jgi:NAD(P)-dependent dehydrogenase (short-subunit alcohol dehydrogenase family)
MFDTLDAFSLGLAKEVGREGIRVVSVRPGHHAHGDLLDERDRKSGGDRPAGHRHLADRRAE